MTTSLTAIEAADKAATPGPWESIDSDQGHPCGPECVVWAPGVESEDHTGWVAGSDDGDSGIVNTGIGGRPDAELIALYRNATPQLAQALRAVLALHVPEDVHEYDDVNGVFVYRDDELVVTDRLCRGCTADYNLELLADCAWTGDEPGNVPWPCATHQAITDAGVTP